MELFDHCTVITTRLITMGTEEINWSVFVTGNAIVTISVDHYKGFAAYV